MTRDADPELPDAVRVAARFLAWLGGAIGAITVVLSTLGFLVEHAYLDMLGVPRSLFEARPIEYLVSGGQLLAGLLPLALTGGGFFIADYWWLVLLVAVIAVVARWRTWSGDGRLLAFATVHAGWLGWLLQRFAAGSGRDLPGVAMLSFTTVIALAYGFAELLPRSAPASDQPRWFAPRLFYVSVLVCAIIALPYTRGSRALERQQPVLEFLGKDRTYFCELSTSSAGAAACATSRWQLIDIGKDRAILRSVADGQIYIVPVATLSTFRLLAEPPK